ncbi:MAG: ribosome biogenesis GTPase Der [Planctomycetes bacterium]|nr:ribosome biogenesis GTPase Der [Planctomycetota bacterium]
MTLPTVAIVGRPNVGKSSLFNAIVGQMISIVDPMAGVTRDRVSTIVCHDDRYFELVDTGGYGIVDSDALSEHIENQIFLALASAAVVVFVVDVQEGVTSLDRTTAELLRKYNLKVILAANKADMPQHTNNAMEFLSLGFGEPICISTTHNLNKTMILERICAELDHLPKEKPKDAVMKIAIVGKRNAGKSTFVNAVVGQDRVIVSEVPGTTRDAVDVRFEKDGRTVIIIDTAGVRKKGKMDDGVEFYGYTRAERSVKRADVILLLMDATTPVSQVDKKLVSLIVDEYKPCVLVVNKWDLAKGFAGTDDYANYLNKMIPGMPHAPIAFTTAKDQKNVASVLDLATELYKQASVKIPTAKLNKAIEILREERISTRKSGVPRIYYGTQVSVRPVSLLLFVNRIRLFDDNFRRHAMNRLAELLGLEEVPIRLLLRERMRRKLE